VPVADTCNPSYSGGRDQEDRDSKSAQVKRLGDPITKNKTKQNKKITKKGKKKKKKKEKQKGKLHTVMMTISEKGLLCRLYKGFLQTNR
jgi:hypothetical protein